MLELVDHFDIEQENPTKVRDNLLSQIHERADQIYTIASPWISFLAYQQGDVARNIDLLTESVANAQMLVRGAKEAIEARHGEIEEIIIQAREASAAAGAAVFTQDFRKEAETLENRGVRWLIATAALAGVTLIFACFMWLSATELGDGGIIAQRFGGKLAVLIVLFTATLWCGRTYKALMHLATVNGHRAMSIQTLQAFSHAASDVMTKDAVLLEATRAIFGSVPTGFLDGGGSGSGDRDLKIIELARNAGKGGGAG